MCICNGLSPRLCAIEGRAVFTMVVSSDCIKKPKATIHNCQRVLSGRSVIYSVTVCLGLREKRSRRRSKKRYTTGVVYSVRSWLITSPPTMVIPRGCRSSEPSAARQYQRQRTKQRRQGSHHNRAKTQQTGLENSFLRRQVTGAVGLQAQNRPS
ncbi:Uncharacterised protein [Escherichia coli]|nr:Uncharacterised protein [Escherichia coli]